MSEETTDTSVSYQLVITDGSLGAYQVMVCLGNATTAPWSGGTVSNAPVWDDADANAFVQALVAAYHQHAPAGSTPQIQYNKFSVNQDQISFTVDPSTGAVS